MDNIYYYSNLDKMKSDYKYYDSTSNMYDIFCKIYKSIELQK